MKKQNLFYFCILLCLFLSLSACSLSDKEGRGWRDDILIAQECGEEGIACCVDQEPACSYGSCCYDPNGSEANYCSESCDFGSLGSFCREGADCDSGLACQDSYCVECGELDQACCGDTCSGNLACFRGTCASCGETDNPCCQEEPFCLKSDTSLLDRAECNKELCIECGANGNPPCDLEPKCNPDHLLNNDKCFRCGGFNQPCCQNVTPEQTEKYCLEDDLVCKLDFCSR